MSSERNITCAAVVDDGTLTGRHEGAVRAECAGGDTEATRICRECGNTWCSEHNAAGCAPATVARCCGEEDMEPLDEDPRLTLARALRDAWAERDAARVASTPGEREAMLRAALDNREAFARDLTAVVGALTQECDTLREQLAARERLAAGPCCDCDGRGERSGARRGGD